MISKIGSKSAKKHTDQSKDTAHLVLNQKIAKSVLSGKEVKTEEVLKEERKVPKIETKTKLADEAELITDQSR